MYWTILRRELLGRKRQTIIVAAGLAVAIALVIVVSALSSGIRQAQSETLQNVYGVGTDITVTGAAAQPGEGGVPLFEFGQNDGHTSDGTTTLNQSRLITGPGRETIDADTVQTVADIDGVASATGVLSLSNMTFSGEIPNSMQGGQDMQDGSADQQPQGQMQVGRSGGGAFGIDSFTVLGVDPAAAGIGPLSATTISSGRAFTTDDDGSNVALVDESYATSNDIAVGDTVEVASTDVQVIGIVSSTGDEADTAANVYVPLTTARTLSGLGDVVTAVYVSAESASGISTVQSAIERALPDATVSSQADLAAQVSGSLTSAASLITKLGTWLSLIVLVVALTIAMLLTSSGVSRRTREFGTLKAIGWSNRRVVSQLAGESAIQALIGGVVGLALGLGAILVINIAGITIRESNQAAPGSGAVGFPGGGPGTDNTGGMPSGFPGAQGVLPGGFGERLGQATQDIVLHAPVTLWVIVAALGLSLLGGVLAGVLGAWRAARLSPVEALRTIA